MSDAALTRTSTWPGAGIGSGRSTRVSASRPKVLRISNAFICLSPGGVYPEVASTPVDRQAADAAAGNASFGRGLPPAPAGQPLAQGLRPQAVQVGVDHRHHHQGEQGGGDEAADHRPGHGGAHLRPGADGEGQGQHAEDHGQGGHDDGPQPGAAGADEGLVPAHALAARPGS